MPGFIKVAGEQRPVAVPYVKVAGAWKPVAIGWVKVAGEWKIWHTAEVVDNFNRADSGTLGTASNDFSVWTNLVGTWGIANNQAETATTAGPHVASIPLYKATTDVTVEVDIPSGTGVGAAFWVNDANNWWAAIPGRRTKTTAAFYSCPSGYSPATSSTSVTCSRTTYADKIVTTPNTTTRQETTSQVPYYYCNSGTLSGSQCCSPETTAPTQSTTTRYTCPSGYSGPSATNRCGKSRYKVYSENCGYQGCTSSSNCSVGSSSSLTAKCTGSCGYEAPNGGLVVGCKCYFCTQVCSCAPDYNLSCSNCSGSYFVFATQSTTTTYSCPAGYTKSGSGASTTCTRQVCTAAEVGYNTVTACPTVTNYILDGKDGSTCNYVARPPYCPSGYSPRFSDPNIYTDACYKNEYTSSTFNPATTTYPQVVRIYKSVNGTVSQEYQSDIGADPRSIQVTTSGNNINFKGYSAAGAAGTAFSSKTFTATNPARSTIVGIVKNGNQAVGQANFIDNFRAE